MTNRLLRYTSLSSRTKKAAVRVVPFLRKSDYNLTLSHSHRFVWFRVSKVGTRTLLHEFSKIGVDVEKSHQRFIYYTEGSYPDYYKFAFVRNPWDRLVSAWTNKVVDSNAFRLEDSLRAELQSFDKFVQYIGKLDLSKSDIHIRPQVLAIDLKNVNFVGRYESYEEHVRYVFDALTLPLVELSRHNNSKGKKPSYREYYTDYLAEKISVLYSADVEQFNYEF